MIGTTMTKVLAIDIGGTKFTLGAFDDGCLRHRESCSTDRDGGPAWMLSQIENILQRWRLAHGFEPEACGIGFGGPVDFPSQTVTMSTHVSGWASYPLVSKVSDLIGAPVLIDNDANVGALGEAHFGAGRGLETSFYLTLSTGIGGGIFSHGSVLRGADSYAGEIGHINIVPDGPDCLCGSNGCFERMCCGLWLERDFGKPAVALFQDPDFLQNYFTRHYLVYLARGLKAALMLLNPHRIIIGGGLSKAGEQLFAPLRAELDRQLTSWSKARRDVVPAQLQDDSVLYGALALAQSCVASPARIKKI